MGQDKLGFVIGGVQKAGTCTLDAIFRLHPQIQMARDKEPHFFDDDVRDWRAPDYGPLNALFSDKNPGLRGEATPITLYWRPAIVRLRDYNPDLRFILILRDPVTRAFSNWRKEFSIGRETLPFAEAIRAGRDRVRARPGGLHRVFSYVERGLYAEQLDDLQEHFPADAIHIEIFEELFRDRAAGLERIAAFLGVDSFPDDIPDLHLNAARDFAYPSTLTPEDADHLSALFHDDIKRLETRIGRPIPDWRRGASV